MEDKPEITLYIGDENEATTTDIITMLNSLPTSLYTIKRLPTNETEKRSLMTEIRKMRTKLDVYVVQDKWNAKNINKPPILAIREHMYPWWYLDKDPNKVWNELKEIMDEYEKARIKDIEEKIEKFDETKGILTTEETDMWIKATSKKVKKLIKTPNKLYAEINNWTEDKRAGFMVGWNATNHDTIPDKLRKIAYELESQ